MMKVHNQLALRDIIASGLGVGLIQSVERPYEQKANFLEEAIPPADCTSAHAWEFWPPFLMACPVDFGYT